MQFYFTTWMENGALQVHLALQEAERERFVTSLEEKGVAYHVFDYSMRVSLPFQLLIRSAVDRIMTEGNNFLRTASPYFARLFERG